MTSLDDRSFFAAPPRRPMRIPRYISDARLREVLRDRLGCTPTGERELFCAYWVTPDGHRFRVLDPIIDPSGSYTVGPNGQWQRVYSLDYARRLLAYLIGRLRSAPRPAPQTMASMEIAAPAAEPYRRIDFKV
jgi:hypothetical protein